MTTNVTTTRRYDLDWLRIFGIAAVFIFHSCRFFDLDGWHVKNPTTYLGVEIWIGFLASWLMPLMFLISGASLYYALGTRGNGAFIKDKVLRLFVPLAVGAFTHVALQVYLERVSHQQFAGTFIDFLPHYFDGLYGFNGNFAWMGLHLWYLLVLFVFSLALLPLFRWLKIGGGQRVLNRMGSFLAKPKMIYLLVLPLALLRSTLNPDSFFGRDDFGGWSLLIYVLFFVYGFVIISHAGVQQRIQQLRQTSLNAGGIMGAVMIALYVAWSETSFGTLPYVIMNSAYALLSWCWLLTILGYGFKRFTKSTPFLQYASEGVLPFYVLHQTVLIVVGYFVVQWNIPDLLKWLIITPTSFIIILVLYEFVVRRANVLRFLFGMKPKQRDARDIRSALAKQGA